MESLDGHSLFRFLGFGNPRAEVVFIGAEETLAAAHVTDEPANVRSAFTPSVDLHAVASAQGPQPPGPAAPVAPTCTAMTRILLALQGCSDPTVDEIRRYQSDRFGLASEPGAMIELMPKHAEGVTSWAYASVFPEFPTRDEYRARYLDERVAMLQIHLAYEPRIVIAYGEEHWELYKCIFPSVRKWRAEGPFEFGTLRDTHVVLTPHFASPAMHGGRRALLDAVVAMKAA
jgi:hypothetical protein